MTVSEHRLEDHRDAKGLFRSGWKLGFVRLVTIGSGMLLSALLARGLKPDGYGQYLFALSIAQFLAMPVLAGLPNLVTRQVAIYRAHGDWLRLRGMLKWSSRFVSLMALFVALGCLSWLWLKPGMTANNRAYLWLLPFVLAMTQMQVASSAINGFERPLQASLPDGTIRPLLMLVLIGAAFLGGFLSPATALACNALANAAAAIWAVWYFRRHIYPLHPLASGAAVMESRSWFLSLLPLGMITISSFISTQLDTVMLGAIATKSEVAIYGIALQIAGLVALTRNLIYGVAGPRIARMWAQQDRAGLTLLIRNTNAITAATTTVSWLGVLMLGNWTIRLLVGVEYQSAAMVAVAASLSPVIASMFGPSPLVLIMTGHEKVYLWNSMVMAASNVAFNLLLIPRLGAIGAVVATIISEFALQILSNRSVRRLCGLRTDIVHTLSSFLGDRARMH